jgi:hypothetical protein
VAFITLGGEAS